MYVCMYMYVCTVCICILQMKEIDTIHIEKDFKTFVLVLNK